MSAQMLKELSDAAKYDKLVDMAQKERVELMGIEQVLPAVPEGPEEVITSEKSRLLTDLVKSNLKEIVIGPSLINTITDYLKSNEDLINFNKFFPTFKRIVGIKKIRSLDRFTKDWELFKSQNLGVELATPLQLVESKTVDDKSKMIKSLNTEPIESIEEKFRKSLELHYKKPFIEIDSFEYPLMTLKSGKISLTKTDIINRKPDEISLIKIRGGATQKKTTDIKIKTILYYNNPTLFDNTPKLGIDILKKVDWEGPIEIGSGISKKKSIHIHFP